MYIQQQNYDTNDFVFVYLKRVTMHLNRGAPLYLNVYRLFNFTSSPISDFKKNVLDNQKYGKWKWEPVNTLPI